jgi:AcrR family transcriptional regulator
MAARSASRASRATAPRRNGTARNATREKILRAAERLFAREGEDRVTLRQIARAADQGNVAAVQYHFGGKDALLAEIVERHQAEIDAARRLLLDSDEEEGRSHDLSALLHVLVAPLAAQLDTPSGRAYLQIQARRSTSDTLHPAIAWWPSCSFTHSPIEPSRKRPARDPMPRGSSSSAR